MLGSALSGLPPCIQPAMDQEDTVALRGYKAPWRGELILACNKCQKKLKKRGAGKFASLKKWFKKRSRADDEGPAVKVVGIDCLKLCPKGGITISTQHQIGEAGREVSIVRSEADLEQLYSQVSQLRTQS